MGGSDHLGVVRPIRGGPAPPPRSPGTSRGLPSTHHLKSSDAHPPADPCTSIYRPYRIRAVHVAQSWISNATVASRRVASPLSPLCTVGREGCLHPLCRPVRGQQWRYPDQGMGALGTGAVVTRYSVPPSTAHPRMSMRRRGAWRSSRENKAAAPRRCTAAAYRQHRTACACCMKSASDVPLPLLAGCALPTINPGGHVLRVDPETLDPGKAGARRGRPRPPPPTAQERPDVLWSWSSRRWITPALCVRFDPSNCRPWRSSGFCRRLNS